MGREANATYSRDSRWRCGGRTTRSSPSSVGLQIRGDTPGKAKVPMMNSQRQNNNLRNKQELDGIRNDFLFISSVEQPLSLKPVKFTKQDIFP